MHRANEQHTTRRPIQRQAPTAKFKPTLYQKLVGLQGVIRDMRPHLPPREATLLEILVDASLSWGRPNCAFTLDELATRCNMSRRTVSRAQTGLASTGLVEVQFDGHRNRYTVRLDMGDQVSLNLPKKDPRAAYSGLKRPKGYQHNKGYATEVQPGCVYRVVHRDSGKSYIGQTCDVGARWGALRRARDDSPMSVAMREFGPGAFNYEVLEDGITDQATLDERERHWIREFDSAHPDHGYNVSNGGMRALRTPKQVSHPVIAGEPICHPHDITDGNLPTGDETVLETIAIAPAGGRPASPVDRVREVVGTALAGGAERKAVRVEYKANPVALASTWQQAHLDAGRPHTPWTKAEMGMAKTLCRWWQQDDAKGLHDYLSWVVGNWAELMRVHFAWMTEAPTYPRVNFVVRWRDRLADAYNNSGERSRDMSVDEEAVETLMRRQGLSRVEAEAMVRAGQ